MMNGGRHWLYLSQKPPKGQWNLGSGAPTFPAKKNFGRAELPLRQLGRASVRNDLLRIRNDLLSARNDRLRVRNDPLCAHNDALSSATAPLSCAATLLPRVAAQLSRRATLLSPVTVQVSCVAALLREGTTRLSRVAALLRDDAMAVPRPKMAGNVTFTLPAARNGQNSQPPVGTAHLV